MPPTLKDGFPILDRITNGVLPPRLVSVLYQALPIVVISYAFWDQYADFLSSQRLSTYKGNEEVYDFIIVGGGSAGCVLANRLSRIAEWKILLLEDGGNQNPMQTVPAYFGAMVQIPAIDHEFYTVPQQNACLALKENRSFWPRGRGLGGSSNLNAMYYQRGNPNDFSKWAELSGDDAWKFENILQNFKNVEDYHGMYHNEKWHSQNGEGVYISETDEKRLLPEFLQAGLEMGYPTKDVNGRQEASFSQLDVTIKNGRRVGAYTAFLEPVLHRKNLEIYRYARVIRVEIDEQLRAYGVTYIRHGLKRMARAKLEVILSAGAIDSAKILMLSGIGPRKHLEELGIKCRVDLPVGQNMQDHIMTNLGPFSISSPNKTFLMWRDFSINTIREYFTFRKGLMGTPMATNAVAYVYSSIAREKMASQNMAPENTAPDVQLILLPAAPTFLDIAEKGGNFIPGYLNSYMGSFQKGDAFFVSVMLAKYKSRGELKLASSDPNDQPLLDPRYFSHPDDVRILADGVNFTVTMIENTKAFQKHNARLVDKHLPGCERYPLRSMEYYSCYVRHLTMTVYHHCGTSTMGKGEGDPKAVVDSKLRVIKTTGLRVVDASIIPEIPNANINSMVYMIADKAFEMIVNHWKKEHHLRGLHVK